MRPTDLKFTKREGALETCGASSSFVGLRGSRCSCSKRRRCLTQFSQLQGSLIRRSACVNQMLPDELLLDLVEFRFREFQMVSGLILGAHRAPHAAATLMFAIAVRGKHRHNPGHALLQQ